MADKIFMDGTNENLQRLGGTQRPMKVSAGGTTPEPKTDDKE